MSEAKINLATGFNGGVSVSLRADSGAELLALLADLRAAAAQDSAVMHAAGDLLAESTAIQVIKAAIPTAQVISSPASTVGQPLPQQPPFQTVQQVAQPTPTAPPGIAYPGDCEHGQRVYSDKPARGQVWRRWECAKPWAKGVTDRCKPINVEN